MTSRENLQKKYYRPKKWRLLQTDEEIPRTQPWRKNQLPETSAENSGIGVVGWELLPERVSGCVLSNPSKYVGNGVNRPSSISDKDKTKSGFKNFRSKDEAKYEDMHNKHSNRSIGEGIQKKKKKFYSIDKYSPLAAKQRKLSTKIQIHRKQNKSGQHKLSGKGTWGS
jgi:hypothetical protein